MISVITPLYLFYLYLLFLPYKDRVRANDMVQCVKMLATSLMTLVSSAEPTWWKGELISTSCPLTFTHSQWYTCVHTHLSHTHIHTDVHTPYHSHKYTNVKYSIEIKWEAGCGHMFVTSSLKMLRQEDWKSFGSQPELHI